jgi:SAM-dependent methyltransferase
MTSAKPIADGSTSFNVSNPSKQDIQDRFGERRQAERYRDRFKKGRRQATHLREVTALEKVLKSLPKIEVALDVACGPGRFADLIAANSGRLIQTDYSPHMLAVSREDHPLGEKDGGYFQADARAVSLQDNSVDLIFCHRFLNHIPNPDDRDHIMREFARVTRQYVVLSCLGPPRFIRALRRTYEEMKGTRSLDGHVDMEDLIRNAANAGLTLVSRTPIRSGIVSASFLTFTKKGS